MIENQTAAGVGVPGDVRAGSNGGPKSDGVLTYAKPEVISLKHHAQFNEQWLKERIIEDPSILGLGEVDLKDTERMQPRAGRLDLLLHDSESNRRYEVELMLGTVDESHIIRCIEYWDIERKRYPQYDHVAVLAAENITARFLNVVGLFNSSIPIIAIQVNAIRVGDKIGLHFVKVLDEVIPGEDDEELDGAAPPADRAYWESRGSKESVATAELCFAIVKQIDPSLSLKFNKFYIGLTDQYRARNFILFRPKKQFVRVEGWVADPKPWADRIEAAGLIVLESTKRGNSIKFRLTRDEVERHRELLKGFFETCHRDFDG